MQTREKFFEDTHHKLDLWERKLDEAAQQAETKRAEGWKELRSKRDELARKKRELDRRLEEAKSEATVGWDDVQRNFERSMSDFKRDAKRVLDAVTG